MKVSIIVPIYNVEKQLSKCLDSILNQKIESNLALELILVNDGSPDNSAKIAKSYQAKFPNVIKYLEKENGGLSDARNYGLKYVTGDYISFIDSDDYITDNLYNDLYKYMQENYDLIKFAVNTVDETGKTLSENIPPVFENKTGEEAFDILYKTDRMTEIAWNYLYKKEFFISNNFKYAKGLYHEDFGLTPLIMLKASKVISTNVMGYNYVQTKNSITRGNPQTINKRAMDLLTHYDNMLEKIKEYNISYKSKDNIKIYYTNCILLEINNLQTEEDKNKYIKEIKKRKMARNIRARNFKQLLKKLILSINIKWYLNLRSKEN